MRLYGSERQFALGYIQRLPRAADHCTAAVPPSLGDTMDRNRVQGSWKQLEGKVKAKWGKLTADDLTAINGRREELEGEFNSAMAWRRIKLGRRLMTGLPRKAFSKSL